MDHHKGSPGNLSRGSPHPGQGGGQHLGEEASCSDDDVEPSSNAMHPLHQAPPGPAQAQDLESDLEQFRNQWRREVAQLETTPENTSEEHRAVEEHAPTALEKAMALYMAGMRLEQQGQLYEAMMKYRRALQIEPAVEEAVRGMLVSQRNQQHAKEDRLDNNGNPETGEDSESEAEADEEESAEEEEEEEEDECDDVLTRLQQLSLTEGAFCQPASPQTAPHLSCLPLEVVQLILRWVVSQDVDVRSLEMVGLVCRGLYRLSRDPALWRRICRRVLGEGCGEPPPGTSWRHLYLSRPHVHFCGCYISRTSYIRAGELNGYQDSSYRPWHMVHYYRYLRLFPEGVLAMLTTADEPAATVGHLLTRPPHRGATVSGHWRLKGDVVLAVLTPRCEKVRQRGRPGRNRRGHDKLPYDPGEQTFHMELLVQPTKSGRYQLTWQSYRILTRYLNGNEAWQTINLGDQFPPLSFSRVRSYTACSEAPL